MRHIALIMALTGCGGEVVTTPVAPECHEDPTYTITKKAFTFCRIEGGVQSITIDLDHVEIICKDGPTLWSTPVQAGVLVDIPKEFDE